MNRYLTVDEIADVLGKRRDEVYRLLQSGRLPGHKLQGGPWKATAEDVESYRRGRVADPPVVRELEALQGDVKKTRDAYDEAINRRNDAVLRWHDEGYGVAALVAVTDLSKASIDEIVRLARRQRRH